MNMSLHGCSTLVVRVINNHSLFWLENKVHYLPVEIMQIMMIINNPRALIYFKEWKHKLELNSTLLGDKTVPEHPLSILRIWQGREPKWPTGLK